MTVFVSRSAGISTLSFTFRPVIQQIKRNFKVNAPNIIPLYRYAMSLISRFKHIQFELIPRDQNKEADRLSNLAYQELRLGV
ncbi:MAG: reverse transcriptase-like protein [Nitrososphaeraceae archaeon]